MSISGKYFVFIIDGRKYAIDLHFVEKSILAVEIMPVPEKIRSLLGLINFHGKIIPVIDMAKGFSSIILFPGN